MVVVGCTVTVPPDTGVTAPMPLSMLADVAFVVVHVSIADWPAVMLVGDAVKVAVGGGGGCTVTVACAVAVPKRPVAVSV